MILNQYRLGLVSGLILAMAGTTSAFASARFSLVSVSTYGAPSVISSGAAVAGNGLMGYAGGGAMIEVPMGSGGRFGLELGAIYGDFKSHVNAVALTGTAGAVTLTGDFAYKKITVPVTLKYWATHWLNFNAGGYVSTAYGSLKTTGTLSDPGNVLGLGASSAVDQNGAFGDLAKNLSYGGSAGVGTNFHLTQVASLRLEGRFLYGVNDQGVGSDYTQESYKTREGQIFAGLTFGGGK